MTFACEAKCVTQVAASRQLTLYLCSAQHQRRALCFDDGPVYGVTIVGNRLTMHSSKWVEDQVVSVTFFFRSTSILNSDKVVSPLKPYFDLDTFPDFIKSYLFLCRVADHIAEGVNIGFQKWESEESKLESRNKLKAKSSEVPWRQKFKPTGPRRTVLTSSHFDDGSDSGNFQGEMECIEMEHRELTGEGIENKRPRLPLLQGDRLMQAHLPSLDKAEAYEADLDGRSIPSTVDIRQWIQTIVQE